MKGAVWVLLIGAAALAAAVVAMATRESARSAEEELHSIQAGLAQGLLDREEALTDLDLLLGRTADRIDPILAARMRLARGRMLMDIAAWDRAREDLQAALTLAELSPEERREVENDLIDLDVRAGAYEKGLGLVKAMLDRDPVDGEAWVRAGDLHRAKAARALALAHELALGRLVAQDAEHGRAWLDRLGAMDPADAHRAAVGRELTDLFEVGEEELTQKILRVADEAARENAQARTAYATSLGDPKTHADPRSGGGPGRAVAGLIDLLGRAGRGEEAAWLGTCSLERLQQRGEVETVELLCDVLADLGRLDYASDLARWELGRGAPVAPERLLEMSELFHRAKRFEDLGLATARLLQIGNTAEVSKAALYAGLVEVRRGNHAAGRMLLEGYALGPAPEPFEGARAEAWRAIAAACQKLNLQEVERDALERAIRLDPEGSGPSLARLSSLSSLSSHGGYRVPEEQLAKAMNRMPERTRELLPRWRRMGDLELGAAGISALGVFREDGWRRVRAGASDASPYQLWVLAGALLDNGDASHAEPFVRRLLQQLPNFVPALDLAIPIARKLGRHVELVDLLLRRMEIAGADEKSRAILAKVPLAQLTLSRRLDLMRVDPEGFGRREIARGLVTLGEPERALELVGDGIGANALPHAREVAARAHLDLGDPEQAFRSLEPLGRRVTATAALFELFARASSLSGHHAQLLDATTRAARSLIPQRGRWLSLCDDMLQRGAAVAAMPLIARLDADRRTRGGDVLSRLAWAQLLLGDEAGLALTIRRAAAFDTTGNVDLAAVLACSRSPSWSGLEQAVANLRRSKWRSTRIQGIALSALAGDRKAVREAIDSALSETRVDPLWLLADAVAGREPDRAPPPLPDSMGSEATAEAARFLLSEPPRDPRLLWCVLLAIESAGAGAPGAAGWAQAAIDSLFPAGTDPEEGVWPRWISARIYRARGEIAEERGLLEALVAQAPGFGPAWDRLEDIARSQPAARALAEELRERRLHALGERAGTRAEIALDIARVQRREGDLEGALETVKEAVELLPRSGAVQAELGRIHAARGEWKQAVEALVVASRTGTIGPGSADVGELLRALHEAGRGTTPAIPAEDRLAELDALSKRSPDDPRIPVALARIELEIGPRNPTAAVRRGLARLERFALAHESVLFERLCPGSTGTWVDLYLELEPSLARKFLDKQRKLDSSALEPWIQIGRLRAALGSRGDDLDDLDLVCRMAPIAPVLRERARVRLAGAPTMAQIADLMREVARAQGRKQPDPEVSLQAAKAFVGLGPEGLRPASVLLTKLAWTPDVPADVADAAKVLRAIVTLGRARASEIGRVRRILAELEGRLEDPYHATLALACAGLAGPPARASEP